MSSPLRVRGAVAKWSEKINETHVLIKLLSKAKFYVLKTSSGCNLIAGKSLIVFLVPSTMFCYSIGFRHVQRHQKTKLSQLRYL